MKNFLKNLGESIKHHLVPTEKNNRHPHLLKTEIMLLFLGLILVSQIVLFSGAANILANSYAVFKNMLAAVVPAVLSIETNQYRIANRVQELTFSPVLAAAATLKAEDMAKRGYFAHVGPDGEKPWSWIKKVGYQYSYAGENLAVDFTDSSDITRAWINSPKHRDNLINSRFTEIGIGMATGTYQDRPTIFVVQFFATPVSRTPNVVELASASTTAPSGRPVATLSATSTTTALALATTSAATTSTSALAVADDGAVLGTDAETNPGLSVPGQPELTRGQELVAAAAVSPKDVTASIMLGVALFFVTVILISFIHATSKHESPQFYARLAHSFELHKKFFGRLAVFVIILGAIWLADTLFLGKEVRIAYDSSATTEDASMLE